MGVDCRNDRSLVLTQLEMLLARFAAKGFVLEATFVIAVRVATKKPAALEVPSQIPQQDACGGLKLPSSSSYHPSLSQDEPTLASLDKYLGYRSLHLRHHSCQKHPASTLPSHCASSP